MHGGRFHFLSRRHCRPRVSSCASSETRIAKSSQDAPHNGHPTSVTSFGILLFLLSTTRLHPEPARGHLSSFRLARARWLREIRWYWDSRLTDPRWHNLVCPDALADMSETRGAYWVGSIAFTTTLPNLARHPDDCVPPDAKPLHVFGVHLNNQQASKSSGVVFPFSMATPSSIDRWVIIFNTIFSVTKSPHRVFPA